ncbi:poylsaccharide deacetylase [Coprobacillus sp. CAG:698]|nr:poylsaccharide deacetylase [Coprobacillus sp. CAG:698]
MVKVFRPPEGQFNKASLTVLKDMGYKTFFWSIAYDDWNTKSQKGGDYGYKKVMDNLHNGAIILMHTVSSDNVECLERVIDDARSQGYEFRNLNNFQG